MTRAWLLCLALTACAPENWGPDALSRGTGDIDDETLAFGKASYELYCIGCHGDSGDGEGQAARHFDPRPRDLTKGKLKFAMVPSGQTPHDDDYIAVITSGLDGTAMPTFRFVPLGERKAIVAYIKTFISEPKTPGETIAIPKDPYAKKPDKGIAKGEQLYHALANCNSCHPAYASKTRIAEHFKASDMKLQGFRANMYTSETKDSDWGFPITPPDFLVDRIKTGSDKESIVRVVAAGVTGTAMPNWSASLKAKQLWALAYYVESLATLRDSAQGRALMKELTSQDGGS